MFRCWIVLMICAALGACSTAPVLPMAERAAPVTVPYLNGHLEMQAKVVTDPAHPFDVAMQLLINGERAIDTKKRVIWGRDVIFDGHWRGRRVLVEMKRDIQFIKTHFDLDIYIDGNLVERLHV